MLFMENEFKSLLICFLVVLFLLLSCCCRKGKPRRHLRIAWNVTFTQNFNSHFSLSGPFDSISFMCFEFIHVFVLQMWDFSQPR